MRLKGKRVVIAALVLSMLISVCGCTVTDGVKQNALTPPGGGIPSWTPPIFI